MKITSFTKMIQTSVAALGGLAIALCSSANADGVYGGGSLKDHPLPPPLPNWQGFYIGGHVGGAWSEIETNRNLFFDPFADAAPTGVLIGGSRIDGSGVFGGIQGGYNWQWNHCCWVYGLEIDLGGFGNDGSRTFAAAVPGGNSALIRFEGNAGFYGDVTSRLGYSWNNRALIYAKGGFAWFVPDINITETVFDPAGNTLAVFNNGENREAFTGFTVGGGLEYMVNSSWSLKVEYLFFDFGRDDHDCCFDGVNRFRFDRDLTVNTVKVGFNYLVHPEPAPLK